MTKMLEARPPRRKSMKIDGIHLCNLLNPRFLRRSIDDEMISGYSCNQPARGVALPS